MMISNVTCEVIEITKAKLVCCYYNSKVAWFFVGYCFSKTLPLNGQFGLKD